MLLKSLCFRVAIMSGRATSANRRDLGAANDEEEVTAWFCRHMAAANGQNGQLAAATGAAPALPSP